MKTNLMKKKSNVTQTQIAKALNISVVTVSKALRNYPDISFETTQRVQKLADELGYTPDLIARALSSKRSNIIGVVVPEIDHSFFAAVMEGIYAVAKENNFQIILTVSQEDDQREVENLQTLLAMRVDGILVSVSQKTTDYSIFHLIEKKKIPLVFFDRTIPDKRFSQVVVDDRLGAYHAVEYAISQGYHRIAHLTGPLNISIASERYLGYREALEKNKIEVKEEWIIQCGFSEDNGYRGFKKLVDNNKSDLPEVIFAVNDPVAIGIYDAAEELNLDIPQDIGVIGFSNNRISKYLSPPLTTVMQPAHDIGRNAVQLLIQEIQNPMKYTPRQIIVQTQLVVRESCLKKLA
ncbi:LacI family transcriptional regulator [bacterium]|nr:MAG: LacI family transcriptional regulator [bacterium]